MQNLYKTNLFFLNSNDSDSNHFLIVTNYLRLVSMVNVQHYAALLKNPERLQLKPAYISNYELKTPSYKGIQFLGQLKVCQ